MKGRPPQWTSPGEEITGVGGGEEGGSWWWKEGELRSAIDMKVVRVRLSLSVMDGDVAPSHQEPADRYGGLYCAYRGK